MQPECCTYKSEGGQEGEQKMPNLIQSSLGAQILFVSRPYRHKTSRISHPGTSLHQLRQQMVMTVGCGEETLTQKEHSLKDRDMGTKSMGTSLNRSPLSNHVFISPTLPPTPSRHLCRHSIQPVFYSHLLELVCDHSSNNGVRRTGDLFLCFQRCRAG